MTSKADIFFKEGIFKKQNPQMLVRTKSKRFNLGLLYLWLTFKITKRKMIQS